MTAPEERTVTLSDLAQLRTDLLADCRQSQRDQKEAMEEIKERLLDRHLTKEVFGLTMQRLEKGYAEQNHQMQILRDESRETREIVIRVEERLLAMKAQTEHDAIQAPAQKSALPTWKWLLERVLIPILALLLAGGTGGLVVQQTKPSGPESKQNAEQQP